MGLPPWGDKARPLSHGPGALSPSAPRQARPSWAQRNVVPGMYAHGKVSTRKRRAGGVNPMLSCPAGGVRQKAAADLRIDWPEGGEHAWAVDCLARLSTSAPFDALSHPVRARMHGDREPLTRSQR